MARAVREGVLDAFPAVNVEVFILWTHVLDTDGMEGAERAARVFDDRRVHQFHDPQRLVGQAFAETIHMPTVREVCKLANQELSFYEGILDPSYITGPASVFDTVFFIPPGASWPAAGGERAPGVTSWVTQLDPAIYAGVDATRFRFGEPLRVELTKLAAESFGGVPPGRPQPNVLLIIADDLRTELSAYGDSSGLTPHLDKLAEDGVVFQRAYAQAAASGPSRASLLSGLRPQTTGIFENSFWPDLDLLTLPEQFAASGYETFKIGRVLPNVRKARRHNKSQGERLERRIWTRMIQPVGRTKKQGWSGPDLSASKRRTAAGIHYGPYGMEQLDAEDGRVANGAALFLQQERALPFFLAVGFSKPHLPFFVPQPYYERVSALAIDPTPVPADDLEDIDGMALADVESRATLAPEDRRTAIRGYRAAVALLDDCVGQVLAALEEGGHAENTIVCFVSDHGQLLGEHNLWRDSVLFEETLRVPFLLYVPDAVRAGLARGACARLVELVDLYPSLAELCGLPLPSGLEGTSLIPLLEDLARPWKRAVFSYGSAGVSLRTERWRFTRWENGSTELYDHDTDPREHENLQHSPEHAEVLKELSKRSGQGWRESLPDSVR